MFGLVAWLSINIYLKTSILFVKLSLKAKFAVQYEMNLNEFHIIMDVSTPIEMIFFLLKAKYGRKFLKRSDL